ncbi:MAG: VWA domain-containing protein [Planctomycetaceae bacterium]|nr:VWA domain-containing protein [Planctomycetaceae bacterium]
MSYYALELTRPFWLITLSLLAVVVWFHYRSLSDFSLWQRRLSLVVRSLIVVLLAFALAGLALRSPTKQRTLLVAIDQSESLGEEAKEKANEIIEQLRDSAGDVRVQFVRFANTPSAPVDAPDEWTEEIEKDQRMGSDLSAAIRVAAASIPPDQVPDILLLTDGNQTQGDVLSAATRNGCPVNVIPLPTRDDPEVQLSDVIVPAQVRQGEPFFVEVVVQSNHETSAKVDVFRDDVRVESGKEGTTFQLKKGENRFRIRQTIEDKRQVDFAVQVRSDNDTRLDNNEARGLVFAAGKPSVLVIDQQPEQADSFRWALQEQDLQVEVRPPQGLPTELAELQKYDCLILSNIPATAMTLNQMDIIRTYVEDLGGGFIMTGGDQAFGLGGYYKTTLETILPVRSNFEKEREKPSLAMVLVVDKSGSMGGQKIELAKDAAKGAVELLGPRDQIGVIAFDGSSNWVSELHAASDKNYVIDRIATIEASGGTSIYPALSDANEALLSASAKLKHVILLTDGHSSPGDFDGLASDMAAARMTVSTVAVGNGADQTLLERIAEIGGGRYYFCDDPNAVPQIFAKETVEASKSAINELPFVPQLVRPTPVLSGVDMENAPFLLGYVVTRPKPTSEFILARESGEPLLSWWRYGLGMSVAFTSDISPRWSNEWLAWSGFGPFWAQVIRHAMRKSDASGAFVTVDRTGQQARVTLYAVDSFGNFINQAETQLNLIGPQMETEKLTLRQVAPGRYEAEFPTAERGAYLMELQQKTSTGDIRMRQNRALVVGYPDELKLQSTNESLLREIANLSGGSYNPSIAELFAPSERTVQRRLALWPSLLMTALSLFILDVFLRRIDLSGQTFWRRSPTT